MKVRSGLLLILLLGSALALPVSGQETASDETKRFLADWAARLKDVKSLRVEFTQTKELRILRRPLVSKGVVLLKGQKLLMTVDSQDGTRDTELAVDAARGEARIHYPRQRRLEVFEIGKGGSPDTPFPFFGGDVERLPETHRVRLEREKEGDQERTVLVLAPRDPASKAGETRLGFVEGRVARVRQTTPAGEKLTLEITRFEVGAEIADASVELAVPEGTEVVRPLATKPEPTASPPAPSPDPKAASPAPGR